MSYRRANGLLLVAVAFLLCAFIAFLLYRQSFFANQESFLTQTVSSSVIVAPVLDPVVSSTPQKNNKVLKSFGSCGDESKNSIILSYPTDLLNALLDTVQGSHCEAPKPGFPNYSFILQDPSLVRIAEMTPDYKYIFYLKAETTNASSTYFLYKTDLVTHQTLLVDTYTLSSDWPLQKDFYEDKLMPRESTDGKAFVYFWFIEDPKGRSDSEQYLQEKIVNL